MANDVGKLRDCERALMSRAAEVDDLRVRFLRLLGDIESDKTYVRPQWHSCGLRLCVGCLELESEWLRGRLNDVRDGIVAKLDLDREWFDQNIPEDNPEVGAGLPREAVDQPCVAEMVTHNNGMWLDKVRWSYSDDDVWWRLAIDAVAYCVTLTRNGKTVAFQSMTCDDSRCDGFEMWPDKVKLTWGEAIKMVRSCAPFN